MPKKDGEMSRKGGKKDGDDKVRVAIIKDDKVRAETHAGLNLSSTNT